MGAPPRPAPDLGCGPPAAVGHSAGTTRSAAVSIADPPPVGQLGCLSPADPECSDRSHPGGEETRCSQSGHFVFIQREKRNTLWFYFGLNIS